MRVATAAVGVALLSALAPAQAADRPVVARLSIGGSAFWDGRTEPSTSCGQDCLDFAVQLAAGAARLRVAGDIGGDGSVDVEVLDPRGTSVRRGSSSYSAELYVTAPRPGRWVVRVRGNFSLYRLRAKLERTVPRATGKKALLPDLELIPPYDFTFSSITGPVAGRDPAGCNAYEQLEYAALRCLRFSLGPQNRGPGPLMLRFEPFTGFVEGGKVFQRVRRGDGSVFERPAGTFEYHKTHAHYHHRGFGSLELLRVVDPARGIMQRAGAGPKQGFCMLDFKIARWRSFANDAANSVTQDCSLVETPDGVELGLSAGWGDIYVSSLDGNYVEFGDNPDGRYVVRSVADAENDVLETNERNNAGYAYLEVRGTSIRVLERGHGLSPWDPHKRRADDLFRGTD